MSIAFCSPSPLTLSPDGEGWHFTAPGFHLCLIHISQPSPRNATLRGVLKIRAVWPTWAGWRLQSKPRLIRTLKKNAKRCRKHWECTEGKSDHAELTRLAGQIMNFLDKGSEIDPTHTDFSKVIQHHMGNPKMKNWGLAELEGQETGERGSGVERRIRMDGGHRQSSSRNGQQADLIKYFY